MLEGERALSDGAFMRRALALAERGWGHTAPNPMVGAVVVRDGNVVGEGWHAAYGAAHAETEALAAAGDLAHGATLYVTLEPCNHHGKTPPCSDAIIAAGIARVVVATAELGPIAFGGAEKLRAAGIVVDVGEAERAAQELNAAFFHAIGSDRPFIQLKLAMSLDSAIADHTRRQRWLTGEAARREVHRMRANADAIAVGIGTALADDPHLNVRDYPPPRVQPARIVFDTSARLPLHSNLVRTARGQRTIVVCWSPDPMHASALEHAGVELVHAQSLRDALGALAAMGLQSILVEGGAALAGSLMHEGLVDRLIIFRAPVVLGAGALPAFTGMLQATVEDAERWIVVSSSRLDDDELTIYKPRERGPGAS
jgi:diaminohydroxyphosphoribosylaminopyrimidine deaminase/5-amino-6-(5-phosphoribosylamino)uracil reductase